MDSSDDEPNVDYGGAYLRAEYESDHYRKDSYFFKIQENVALQEKIPLTPEDEERLFCKVNLYLEKPFMLLGIYTLQRLAFLPSTVSFDRLKCMAKIICKNVFNPLTDYALEYSDFYKVFAYLKATATNGGNLVTFEEVLISTFLEELPRKFNYSQRLKCLVENRDIPEEKKRNWLRKQIEDQERVFETITHKSVDFLNRVFQLYPEIVYRVIEFLLQSESEDALHYLCSIIEKVRYRANLETHLACTLTDISGMKILYWENKRGRWFLRLPAAPPLPVGNKTLTPLFENIIRLSEISLRHAPGFRDTFNQLIHDNPQKEKCPQDFIKYSIEDCFKSSNLRHINDFTVDEEDKCDCNIYTMRSLNFTPCHFGNYRPFEKLFWKGLKVRILLPEKQVARTFYKNVQW